MSMNGDKPLLWKEAFCEGGILIFVNESGLSQRSHRCRTGAPHGQTPVLPYNFN
jgi:hypothetical protein